MLRRVEDPEELRQAIRRRQEIADGPADFNHKWIQDNHLVVLAEAIGRHVEECEAGGLAQEIKSQGISQLLAIVNDPLVLEEEVYKFEPDENDFREFSHIFTGINVIAVPAHTNLLAMLFTADDFRLLASTRSFIEAHVSDLATARSEFEEFADSHFEELKPVLKRAAAYMSWINLEK